MCRCTCCQLTASKLGSPPVSDEAANRCRMPRANNLAPATAKEATCNQLEKEDVIFAASEDSSRLRHVAASGGAATRDGAAMCC